MKVDATLRLGYETNNLSSFFISDTLELLNKLNINSHIYFSILLTNINFEQVK